MSLTQNKERFAIGMGLAIAFAIICFGIFARYSSSTVSMNTLYKKNLEKKRVLTEMRIHLLKSVDLEKSAVMALTDRESVEFADQSRAASAEVDHNLPLLLSLVDAAPMPEEKKLVDEFAGCWTEFGKIDRTVLELATENTNLKAAALSREQGTEALQRLERALAAVREAMSGTADEDRVAVQASRVLIAALKISNLHGLHIAEPDAAQMDRIEERMRALETEAAESFVALGGMTGAAATEAAGAEATGTEAAAGTEALAQGQAAFADLMAATAQVVQLSRKNSNIKSLELSLGRKRKIAAQCDEALATLQEALQNKGLKATK